MESTLPLTNVVGFGLEPNDVLLNPAAGEVTYELGVGGNGVDGFDFDHPTGRNICVDLEPGSGTQVFVGAARTPVTTPFDLGTLGACTNLVPAISVADVSIDEGAPSAQASINVTLSQSSNAAVVVDYTTADGTALDGLDYLSAQSSLTFAPGQTSQLITVDLLDDALAEGAETFSVSLSNPVNATLASATAQVTIVDNEASPCGPLDHVRGVDVGVFVAQDCATGVWSVRVVEGGGSFVFYDGSLISSNPLSGIAMVGLEAHDTFTHPSANTINYSFGIGGTGEDGFDFVATPSGSLCLTLDSPTRTIFVGAGRTPFAGSVDLNTLQACQ